MLTPESSLAVMTARVSCRSYEPRALAPDMQAQLETILTALPQPPFPGVWRFQLITPGLQTNGRPEKIGTYGFIKNARHYVAGVIQKSPLAWLNYGFLLERFVLEATAMGLGTCWLGGSFDRHDFSDKLERTSQELLPAVTPVGYPSGATSLQDQLTRWSAQAKTRKPFETLFFKKNFQQPLNRDEAGAHAQALDMVRLGPSASNRQPWRVVQAENGKTFHFFLQHNVLYGTAAKYLFSAENIQMLDLGIALCHFELAAQALHLPGHWQVANPNLDLPSATEYIASWIAA